MRTMPRTTAVRPVITYAPFVPCPAWCDREPGHGLDLFEGEARRHHFSTPVRIAGVRGRIRINQFEVIAPDGTALRRDPIRAEVLNSRRHYDPAELLAAHLAAVTKAGAGA